MPAYVQLVQQVRQALRTGVLHQGDQLPTAREVVTRLGINPNTVLKAYRELEHDGLVETRQGSGTFVVGDLPGPRLTDLHGFQRRVRHLLDAADEAGLTDEDVDAVIATTRRARVEDLGA